MYEHRKQPVVSRTTFYQRILKHILVALVLMTFCLALGVAGYHFTAGLSWLDSLHNASMILSGMGLVDPVKTESGKLFSSFYSLFSGVAFITNIGIILAPAMHRIFHRLHWEED
jgi:hypothetical protein